MNKKKNHVKRKSRSRNPEPLVVSDEATSNNIFPPKMSRSIFEKDTIYEEHKSPYNIYEQNDL